MKKSKYFDPYIQIHNKSGEQVYRCALKRIKRAGVYFIMREKRIVYVGMSTTNIYKTLYRHFQNWNDRRQNRKVYPKTGYKIRVIFCSPIQAARIEKHFVLKITPEDNKDKFTYLSTSDLKSVHRFVPSDLGILAPVEYLTAPF